MLPTRVRLIIPILGATLLLVNWQAAMQDLNQMRVQNQQDWEAKQERKDYMDSKWDDYRRGNSYWVSELEGGKVYQTDAGGTQDTVTG